MRCRRGFGDYIGKLAGDQKSRFLVTREKMPPAGLSGVTR